MKDIMRSAMAMRAIRTALNEDLSNADGLSGRKWLDATSAALVPSGRTAEAGFAGTLEEKKGMERLAGGEKRAFAYEIEFHR